LSFTCLWIIIYLNSSLSDAQLGSQFGSLLPHQPAVMSLCSGWYSRLANTHHNWADWMLRSCSHQVRTFWVWAGSLHNQVIRAHEFLGYSYSLCELCSSYLIAGSGSDLGSTSKMDIILCTLQSTFTIIIMAPMLSNKMRQCIIVWHYEQHLSASDIHTLAGCSLHPVYNILQFHQDYGIVDNPFAHHEPFLRPTNIEITKTLPPAHQELSYSQFQLLSESKISRSRI